MGMPYGSFPPPPRPTFTCAETPQFANQRVGDAVNRTPVWQMTKSSNDDAEIALGAYFCAFDDGLGGSE